MVWYDFVEFALILLSITVIALKYRLLPNEIRLFLFYFILTLLIELASEFFILQGKNNLFLYHFSAPLQYAILCLYFLNLFGQNKNQKILIVLVLSVLVILSISFFLNPLNQYYSFASIMKNIIISILVLMYFRKIFISNLHFEKNVEENVWICTALFIYSLGNFFIEGSMNYLMESDRNISIKLFYLHIALDFLFYIIFICAVTFTKSRPVE
jgi:hypothetical protein